MKTYGPGALAYLDTFGGLVKCKALEILPDDVRVEVQETHAGYTKGEKTRLRKSHVVPRAHVVRRGQFSLRIKTDFVWQA